MCKSPEDQREFEGQLDGENAGHHVDDEDVDEEDVDEDEDVVIRAKWMFDGATTIDGIIQRLREQIVHFERLKADGWDLREEVMDDYGFLVKR